MSRDMSTLSPAQRKLANRLVFLPPGDTLLPPSGLSSSAWWRTARVLVRLGLAETNGYVLSQPRQVATAKARENVRLPRKSS